MRSKLGIFTMILGALCVAASLALFLHNENEDQLAYERSQALMPQIVASIQKTQEERYAASDDDARPSELAPAVGYEQEIRQMTVAEIDGNEYIGFLSIPSISLELPVMADWSYPKLQISPCRYTGNLFADDLVIMAHNFRRHFGSIKDLAIGDEVLFTDMDGTTYAYAVVAVDVLQPSDVEDMTAGEYDLTLFTCTYGGRTRVTIRCDRTEE